MTRQLLLVLLVVLMAATIYWAWPGEVVDDRYATLDEARAARLFERGWLPDILPAGSVDLHVTSRPELGSATGEFHFPPAAFGPFAGRLSAYARPKSTFSGLADEADAHIRHGFPAFQYIADGNTWVFLCKPAQGACSFAMWLSR